MKTLFFKLVDDLLKEPIAIKDGFLELSDAPGPGIEIDEYKLEKFKML